ncbi:helix-turn-helix domain-containing protein [Paenibacillus polymyxa]|uniref:Helix-turn-helix domain n=1 Tax=Paenibacillus polymyxa TaxID=1406 RepID=A0A378XZF9_PAEPO|nr:helix-turn-helix transcriptional regulator [Paenibacillus polymyxa]MCC3256830.1 helix-turn-helix domain-containing protein [Paenibacillus polymyxa]SUA70396.1 Helix-turn-helix domain [Paenibacillus polymyxa]
MLETIGSRARFLRIRKGLTVETMIEDLKIPVFDENNNLSGYKKVTKGTIGNLENDRNKPNIDLIIALSDYFEVSTDWILKGREYEGVKMRSQTEEELQFFYDTTKEEFIQKLEETINKFKNNN